MSLARTSCSLTLFASANPCWPWRRLGSLADRDCLAVMRPLQGTGHAHAQSRRARVFRRAKVHAQQHDGQITPAGAMLMGSLASG